MGEMGSNDMDCWLVLTMTMVADQEATGIGHDHTGEINVLNHPMCLFMGGSSLKTMWV
jgi:hypothetical protein